MNQAYLDASWQEQPGSPDHLGLGGWGMVLLRPGRLPLRAQGRLQAPDNNAAELRAVLEALRVAPAGEALTIHTDNQAVVACVARGRGPEHLRELTREIQTEAQARQIPLLARPARRTARHLQTAHELANAARRGSHQTDGGSGHSDSEEVRWAEIVLEHRPTLSEARINLRRAGTDGLAERVTLHLPTDPESEVPPSVQVLLAVLELARPGETLQVRRASKIAQAMWNNPERALRPGVQAQLQQARAQAADRQIEVEFVG